jgi:probable F420-dependent oxidoreductase
MRFGIHLPQYGRAAGAEAITRVARHAEELGFDDLWVSDHLAVPSGAPYPPAYLFEPVVALTWAAAATSRIGLGTSVLVLPYRHPLHLAKELASLDVLAGGRLILGAAAGWLEGEFEALNVPFRERGQRTDEAIDAMRACWEQSPVTFDGPSVHIHDMKVQPQPARRIPIWIGGMSGAAVARALHRGDGWHGTFADPEEARPILDRLIAERPEGFVISMRQNWDALTEDEAAIRGGIEAFAGLGVDHLLASPRQNDVDGWLRSVDRLLEITADYR